MTSLPPHTQLKQGTYTILETAGEPGGFGIAYRASWESMARDVAIKELFISDSHFCSRAQSGREIVTTVEKQQEFTDYIDKFKEEAKHLFDLHHENVVRVYDYFEENNTAYIVMEYLAGESLADHVYSKGKLEEREALDLMEKLCKTVSTLHNKGIIHRDISPENIMFREAGTPVLIDFGLAREHISRKTKTMVAYRAGYSPLEAYSSSGAKSSQSDIYSLGAVLYFMLIGEDPPEVTQLAHGAEELRLPAELNQHFQGAINKAMQIKINARPASANELLSEMKGGSGHLKNRSHKAPPIEVSSAIAYTSCPITGMEFAKVPGGNFTMGDVWGDGADNEKPTHKVTVSPFLLGKHPVTQAQWLMVMGGENPAGLIRADLVDPNKPVVNISWDDAQEFIKRFYRKTGLKSRLPSEAEWEYAARSGGFDHKWAGTDHESYLSDYAYYAKGHWKRTGYNKYSRIGSPAEVGERLANDLGLYDMSGNVMEWCEDIWHDNYENAPSDAAAWIKEGNSSLRVCRGGSWYCPAIDCRISNREKHSKGLAGAGFGFRLALDSK